MGDRYRLVAPLRRGGTSVVWHGRDRVLERDVAVKLLDHRRAGDPVLVRRLRVEAQAAASLVHPHVVTVYDFGEAQLDGRTVPYAVLELVDGSPLSEVLATGPLPWQEAVTIGAQVAAALAAAHAHGVVHRDIKPDNVMCTADGVKLVDFGISATIGDTDLEPDGELLCTPAYLAPERMESGPVRAACDVYGLGLVLYKSLTGALPWQWDGVADLLAAHRRVDPAPLPPLPGIPPEATDLCRSCLAKRPADRPSSAEAAQVLARTAGTAAVATAVPARRQQRSGPDWYGQMAPTVDVRVVDAHAVDPRPPGSRRRVMAVAVER